MRRDLAEGIMRAGADLGLNIDVQYDYSGRGMFGRTTSAVTVDSLATLVAAAAAFGAKVGWQARGSRDPSTGAVTEAVVELRRLRTDDLGRGLVAY